MIPAYETFGGTWPFMPRFFDGNGFRMHYIDEGSGDPIVCLHGEPTWGYLYRQFIPSLSETNRVIVPDHMGFGKSETPQSREYSMKAHVDNLTNLIESLDLQNITLVMHDWGGPIGAAFTLRHSDRVQRLFFCNSIAGYGNAKFDLETPWFGFIRKHHEEGTLHDVLGHLSVNVLSIMKLIGLENVGAANSDWLEAYSAPFPTAEECKGAIEFPLEVILARFAPYMTEGFEMLNNLKTKPAMLAVGMRDGAVAPAVHIADFEGIWPDRPIIKLPQVGHFCQEDAPETLIALIQLFMQTN
jgi:cis-3-alkyl-4-acyloxetan-2-one decarboxylase